MARFACLVALLALVSAVQGFHNLKQQNITDACLWNIYQGTQLIPRIIDDVTKGDILNLMTDVMKFIPLINATKNNCSQFDLLDIANRTTINATMDCYNSAQNVVAVFEILAKDVSAGDMSAVIRDVTWLLGNFSTTSAVCQRAMQVLSNPHFYANFWNSTACWAVHERSSDIMFAIIDAYKRGNYTEMLPLIFPFIGTSAETFRQCSVWPNSFAHRQNGSNFSYPEFIMFENLRKGDPGQCLADITAVISVVNTIMTDINAGDFQKVIQDVMAAVPLVKKLLADCLSYRPTIETIMPYLNKTLIRQFQYCASDVMRLKHDVLSLIKRALRDGPESVMFDVVGLVGNAKKLFNECTNNGQFFPLKSIINHFPSEFCTQTQNDAAGIITMMVMNYHKNKVNGLTWLPEVINRVKTVLDVCHRDQF